MLMLLNSSMEMCANSIYIDYWFWSTLPLAQETFGSELLAPWQKDSQKNIEAVVTFGACCGLWLNVFLLLSLSSLTHTQIHMHAHAQL